ncbi:MAG: hypothetical protein ACK4RT_11575 [Erythrobacter sp.]
MKALLASLPLFATAPLAAHEPTPEQAEVIAAAEAFFAALRSDDKTALAGQMLPEGMIFVHSRMKPENPRVDVVPVADHLARWAKGTRKFNEVMRYDSVLVDGDMALVWGPYRFIAEGKTSYCGINSLSLVKTESGWKVANTSFTMELPERCAALGAPEARAP